MPAPNCPNCVLGKILSKYHDNSAAVAGKDKKTSNKLAAESLLEKKLFELAGSLAD